MPKSCDAVVVGGGAAGLMAAYFAARRGLNVVVVEKNDGPPRKLLITGKGRCNVCNSCAPEEFLENVRLGAKFLNSAARGFTAADIAEFFEANGVPLVVERGRRVFPKSGRAADVAAALRAAALGAGAVIKTSTARVIVVEAGAVAGVSLANGETIACRAVVIATGGLSYPKTGSTGDGYRLAKLLGHTVGELAPSLVGIDCRGAEFATLEGLSLRNVELSARLKSGKQLFSERGEMLFTKTGVSGPLVLSLSAHLVGVDYADVEMEIDLKPALDEKTLDARLLRDFKQNSNRQFKNSLFELLPRSLVPVVVAHSGIDAEKPVNAVTAIERKALLEVLKRFSLTPEKPEPIARAVITAGGVATAELEPKTMQSKLVRGLYFAGEVIDADAYTGGYNLMIAFCTGAAAGKHILEGDNA